MRKKTALVTIAHPDDEAFGPAGLIAILSKTYDVHLICVTDGASDPRFHTLGNKLADIRKKELQASARILGITKVYYLSYKDGSLSNNLYHEIAQKILDICRRVLPTCIVTSEWRGVSGHLDHVAVSFISSYVYMKMDSIDAIIYNATTKQTSERMQDYFIFFPPGFDRDDVDLVVDISKVFDIKCAAAECHVSQIHDVERIIKRWNNTVKEELFFVTKRREFRIP